MAFLKILFCDYVHSVCLVYIIASVKFSSKTVFTYSEFKIICKSRGKLKDFSTLRPSNLFFFLARDTKSKSFFYLLLGCPTQNVGYFQGNGFTHMMLINLFSWNFSNQKSTGDWWWGSVEWLSVRCGLRQQPILQSISQWYVICVFFWQYC